MEFDEFMKIEGCQTKDRHLFIGSGGKNKAAKGGGEELLETVRYISIHHSPFHPLSQIEHDTNEVYLFLQT